MLSPSLELSIVATGTTVGTLVAAAGNVSVDPGTVVGGGGAAILLILVQVVNNASKSWIALNEKRGELIKAQMDDLKDAADERERLSLHRKAQRSFWAHQMGKHTGPQVPVTPVNDVPTAPMDIPLDSGHFPAASRR